MKLKTQVRDLLRKPSTYKRAGWKDSELANYLNADLKVVRAILKELIAEGKVSYTHSQKRYKWLR